MRAFTPLELIGLLVATVMGAGCDRAEVGGRGGDPSSRTDTRPPREARVSRSQAGARPPENLPKGARPRLYNRVVVLCIGIDDYRSPTIADLAYAERDAEAVARVLRALYGYEVVPLRGKLATREGIWATLRETAARLGEKDVLIVYFAGHGKVIELPSYGRTGYLLPHDADVDLSDASDPERWAAQALDMRELVDFTRSMKAHHVLIVADACSSGFMTKRGSFAGRRDLQLLLSEPSRIVVAATTEAQAALEDRNAEHGYFTGSLLEQLEGLATKDEPEAASVTDVFAEVRRQVGRQSKSMTPQMASVGDGDGEFVFIPLRVPQRDIQVALDGGLDSALRSAYERTARRFAQRSRLEDVLAAYQGADYRYTIRPAEREKVWRGRVERLRENAALGDPLALAALHYCYANGLGVDSEDAREAFRFARLAYDTGRPEGKHVLARCLAEGIGVERNRVAAERLLREAAEGGFPVSRFAVRIETLRKIWAARGGKKVAFDEGEVEQTLDDVCDAAGSGVFIAQFELAMFHLHGDAGVRKDPKTALALLEDAAENGWPLASFRLYEIYEGAVPDAVMPDHQKALRYLRQAAADGSPDAQFALAKASLEGKGVGQSDQEARKWAELAASQGHARAMLLLHTIHYFGRGVPKDLETAHAYLEKAEAAGDARAVLILGYAHRDGEYYPVDRAKSLAYFLKAGEMGMAEGWFMAGKHHEELYRAGIESFGPIDPPPALIGHGRTAARYFKEAARMGHVEAQKVLDTEAFQREFLRGDGGRAG